MMEYGMSQQQGRNQWYGKDRWYGKEWGMGRNGVWEGMGYGKESCMGMFGEGSGRSALPFSSELLHLSQSRNLYVQSCEIVDLRFDLAAMVYFCYVGVEQVCGVVGTGARGSRDEGTLGLCLHQCHRVALYVLGIVFTAMGMDVVGVKVGSVDQSSINGVSIPSSVVFEGRFSEVSREGTVGDPSCRLFELHQGRNTFQMSFACQPTVSYFYYSRDRSIAYPFPSCCCCTRPSCPFTASIFCLSSEGFIFLVDLLASAMLVGRQCLGDVASCWSCLVDTPLGLRQLLDWYLFSLRSGCFSLLRCCCCLGERRSSLSPRGRRSSMQLSILWRTSGLASMACWVQLRQFSWASLVQGARPIMLRQASVEWWNFSSFLKQCFSNPSTPHVSSSNMLGSSFRFLVAFPKVFSGKQILQPPSRPSFDDALSIQKIIIVLFKPTSIRTTSSVGMDTQEEDGRMEGI